MSVECAFQGSKVFEYGGPYQDIYQAFSIEAKKDERLRTSWDVVGFQLFDEPFPTEPKTAFFDWLYLKALSQNPVYAKMLMRFEGFSDIHFNPEKSINCQPRATALFVALEKKGALKAVLKDREFYFSIINNTQIAKEEKVHEVKQNESYHWTIPTIIIQKRCKIIAGRKSLRSHNNKGSKSCSLHRMGHLNISRNLLFSI